MKDIRPASLGPAADASRATAPELSGSLAIVGIVALTRFLARLGKSGDLRVARGGVYALLSFDRGRLIAAVADDQAGWPALELVLLGMASGEFEFTAGPPSLPPNLDPLDDKEAWARLERVAATRRATAPLSAQSAPTRLAPPRRRRVVFAGLASAVAALLALVWLSANVANGVMFVKGTSMAPLLRPGQLLVMNRGAYRAPERPGPRRGDIVIFRRGAAGGEEYLVKRVIGLPGELVQVDTGRVFVNGTQLDEPYVLATDDYTYPQGGPVRVPDGEYFVLGDNRPVSADSHLGWFVPAADLLGQAWPLPVALPSLPVPASA